MTMRVLRTTSFLNSDEAETNACTLRPTSRFFWRPQDCSKRPKASLRSEEETAAAVSRWSMLRASLRLPESQRRWKCCCGENEIEGVIVVVAFVVVVVVLL